MPTRSTLRFLLGDEPRELGDIRPDLTILDYLRRIEGRRGTKEGCGEGDCGACTVAVGELVDGRIQYRAVNACFQLLVTVDGKQLLTIEHLERDGQLEAIQVAMVEEHGSQCGFCTPGFVMSLWVASQNGASLDRRSTDETLADISSLCAAFCVELEGTQVRSARICFGGMAGVPKRALAAELALVGGEFNAANVELAMAALASDYQPYQEYRQVRTHGSANHGLNSLRRG